MITNNHIDAYKKATQTSSNELYRVYNLILNSLSIAENQQNYDMLEASNHAMNGILTLLSALDMKYEVSDDLSALYHYCIQRLSEMGNSNHEQRLIILKEVYNLMDGLYSAWTEIREI